MSYSYNQNTLLSIRELMPTASSLNVLSLSEEIRDCIHPVANWKGWLAHNGHVRLCRAWRAPSSTEPQSGVSSPPPSLCGTPCPLPTPNTDWNASCEQPGSSQARNKCWLVFCMVPKTDSSGIMADPSHLAHCLSDSFDPATGLTPSAPGPFFFFH